MRSLLVLIMVFLLTHANGVFANVKYTIKSGDTLQKIAGTQLGNRSRWKDILAMNPSAIKGNGNLIFPGEVIRIPVAINGPSREEKPVAVKAESTSSESVADKKAEDKVLKVLMSTGEYAPFTGAGLDNGGVFTEIVKKVFSRMGYKYQIDFMGWSTAMKLAHERGFYHVTFPWYENDERRTNYYYSDPVQPTVVSAFSLKNSGFLYTKKSDLRHKTICRPEGYFTHDISDMVEAGVLKHVAPPTTKDCFDLLIKGKVDLVSEDDQVGQKVLVELGIEEKVTISDEPMMIRPLHVIFPKRFGETAVKLRDDFNQGLSALAETGELAEIVVRHLSSE